MAISDNDRQVLQALDEAWSTHKELGDLLEFYRELYEVQFSAKADLPEQQPRDERAMTWRLEGGIPQLTFDQLGLDPDSFLQLVLEIAAILQHHNPGWQIDWEEWPAERLIKVAREVFETWKTLTAPGAATEGNRDARRSEGQAAVLSVAFALAPYLLRAGETILPRLDLSLWTREYCPVCGGWPNLALLEAKHGARLLVCSRCTSTWPCSRVGCPFCMSKAKQTYYRSEDGVYRLYVCPDCHHYLKTVDLREVHRPVYPMVERLLTVGMDLAARQEGFED